MFSIRAGLAMFVAALAAAVNTSSAQTPAPAPLPATAPKLIVVLVLDQFRADYFELYGQQWSRGLRRLFDRGAVFTQAAYPYAATYTCAGHATIGTGAFPAVHGMSSNDFHDRTLRRNIPCAFDPSATSVAFGGVTGRERHSGRNLLVPTFAEELRRLSGTQTRIVAVAQKPRSSIMFAGRGHADTVAVFEEDDGTWATSDAYTTTPWADVDQFVRANPLKAAFGTVWELLNPPASYRFLDDAPGEARTSPWTRTFPHPLTSSKGVPDNEFVTAWEKSPWNDEFLTNLAIHLLKARGLGKGPGTDVLTLSLPSLDHIGHDFGPRSHEVQDVLLRADIQVGKLLDAVEAQVGNRYALGFSSDHGVALIPEQVIAEGGDAGRISTADVRNTVNTAVEKVLGTPGPHVASVWDSQIALLPGVVDLVRFKAGGFDAVKAAVVGVRGIASAFSVDDIVNGAATPDPALRAWRLSYVPGRSGDFVFAQKPNWIVRGATGSTHGSLNAYDQRVPVLFYGAAFRTGRYEAAASPADLAPTLMHLAGLKLPRAQGRALTEAFVR